MALCFNRQRDKPNLNQSIDVHVRHQAQMIQTKYFPCDHGRNSTIIRDPVVLQEPKQDWAVNSIATSGAHYELNWNEVNSNDKRPMLLDATSIRVAGAMACFYLIEAEWRIYASVI